MTYAPNDFKIGLFVLGGIAILVAGVFVFGASKWLEGKMMQETYINGSADGLKVGAAVTLRGIPIGQVTKVNFTWNIFHRPEPRYVYVEFEVDKKVSLAPPGTPYGEFIKEEVRKGLRARIKSQGLASGTVILSLEYLNPEQNPPVEFPWTPRHIYIPAAKGAMNEIMGGLDKVVGSLNQIDFQKIGTLLENDLASGGKVLGHVDEMNLRAIGTNVDGLMVELRQVANQLHAFVGATNQVPRATLDEISSRANNLLGQAQNTVGRLDQDVARVDLVSLNEALENLRRASEQLNETISKIKEYPSGAIFGKPPPRVPEVERSRR